MFGCLRRIAGLLVLLVLLAVGWFFRDEIGAQWQRWFGTPEAELTEEQLAARATTKLEALAERQETEAVGFSEAEIQALMRQRFSPMLPGYVRDPGLDFENGKMAFSFRVASGDLPLLDDLGPAAGFLPDTVEVVTKGALRSTSEPRARFTVEEVTAAKIPLPGRIIPKLLRRVREAAVLGGEDNTILAPLPSGVGAAYVQGDSLFLVPTGAGTSGTTQ